MGLLVVGEGLTDPLLLQFPHKHILIYILQRFLTDLASHPLNNLPQHLDPHLTIFNPNHTRTDHLNFRTINHFDQYVQYFTPSVKMILQILEVIDVSLLFLVEGEEIGGEGLDGEEMGEEIEGQLVQEDDLGLGMEVDGVVVVEVGGSDQVQAVL